MVVLEIVALKGFIKTCKNWWMEPTKVAAEICQLTTFNEIPKIPVNLLQMEAIYALHDMQLLDRQWNLALQTPGYYGHVVLSRPNRTSYKCL